LKSKIYIGAEVVDRMTLLESQNVLAFLQNLGFSTAESTVEDIAQIREYIINKIVSIDIKERAMKSEMHKMKNRPVRIQSETRTTGMFDHP
jgi:hypothetical protein